MNKEILTLFITTFIVTIIPNIILIKRLIKKDIDFKNVYDWGFGYFLSLGFFLATCIFMLGNFIYIIL